MGGGRFHRGAMETKRKTSGRDALYFRKLRAVGIPRQAVESFRLHSNTEGAIAEVTGKPSATVSADLWQVLWRAMQGECGPFRAGATYNYSTAQQSRTAPRPN